MPKVQCCSGKFYLATDDLVIPSVIDVIFRAGWLVVFAFVAVDAWKGCGLTVKVWLCAALSVTAVAAALLAGMSSEALKGGVLEPQARAAVTPLLQVRLGLVLPIEVAVGVTGVLLAWGRGFSEEGFCLPSEGEGDLSSSSLPPPFVSWWSSREAVKVVVTWFLVDCAVSLLSYAALAKTCCFGRRHNGCHASLLRLFLWAAVRLDTEAAAFIAATAAEFTPDDLAGSDALAAVLLYWRACKLQEGRRLLELEEACSGAKEPEEIIRRSSESSVDWATGVFSRSVDLTTTTATNAGAAATLIDSDKGRASSLAQENQKSKTCLLVSTAVSAAGSSADSPHPAPPSLFFPTPPPVPLPPPCLSELEELRRACWFSLAVYGWPLHAARKAKAYKSPFCCGGGSYLATPCFAAHLALGGGGGGGCCSCSCCPSCLQRFGSSTTTTTTATVRMVGRTEGDNCLGCHTKGLAVALEDLEKGEKGNRHHPPPRRQAGPGREFGPENGASLNPAHGSPGGGLGDDQTAAAATAGGGGGAASSWPSSESGSAPVVCVFASWVKGDHDPSCDGCFPSSLELGSCCSLLPHRDRAGAHPAWAVFVDPLLKAVVVSVRGTLSLSDVANDLWCDETKLPPDNDDDDDDDDNGEDGGGGSNGDKKEGKEGAAGNTKAKGHGGGGEDDEEGDEVAHSGVVKAAAHVFEALLGSRVLHDLLDRGQRPGEGGPGEDNSSNNALLLDGGLSTPILPVDSSDSVGDGGGDGVGGRGVGGRGVGGGCCVGNGGGSGDGSGAVDWREVQRSYRLLLTGHSLGAGIASVLARTLRTDHRTKHWKPRVSCRLVSPVGALYSEKAAAASEGYTLSVTLGDEAVTRLSRRAVETVRDDSLLLLACCPRPKAFIFLQALFSTARTSPQALARALARQEVKEGEQSKEAAFAANGKHANESTAATDDNGNDEDDSSTKENTIKAGGADARTGSNTTNRNGSNSADKSCVVRKGEPRPPRLDQEGATAGGGVPATHGDENSIDNSLGKEESLKSASAGAVENEEEEEEEEEEEKQGEGGRYAPSFPEDGRLSRGGGWDGEARDQRRIQWNRARYPEAHTPLVQPGCPLPSKLAWARVNCCGPGGAATVEAVAARASNPTSSSNSRKDSNDLHRARQVPPQADKTPPQTPPLLRGSRGGYARPMFAPGRLVHLRRRFVEEEEEEEEKEGNSNDGDEDDGNVNGSIGGIGGDCGGEDATAAVGYGQNQISGGVAVSNLKKQQKRQNKNNSNKIKNKPSRRFEAAWVTRDDLACGGREGLGSRLLFPHAITDHFPWHVISALDMAIDSIATTETAHRATATEYPAIFENNLPEGPLPLEVRRT